MKVINEDIGSTMTNHVGDSQRDVQKKMYCLKRTLYKMRNYICKWNKHLALKVRIMHNNGNPNLIQRKQLPESGYLDFQFSFFHSPAVKHWESYLTHFSSVSPSFKWNYNSIFIELISELNVFILWKHLKHWRIEPVLYKDNVMLCKFD